MLMQLRAKNISGSAYLYFVYLITGLSGGLGVCKKKDGTQRCCTNYRQDKGFCIPCEVGTYGDNCTGGPCEYGYYGFGCQSKCSCTSDQYCDKKIGCINKTSKGRADMKERSYISTVVAVIMAVILSVGSFLVVIVFFYNERLKFLHQYLTRLGTNRVVNNASRESEQEDYSQMTRASNNYNMLIPNKRINVVSRVNFTDEDDSYDHIRPFANSQPEES